MSLVRSIPTGYNYWIYSASPAPGRMQVNTSAIGAAAVSLIYPITHYGTNYSYSTKKTYQFVTHTWNLYSAHGSFSVSPGSWTDQLNYSNGLTASSTAPSTTQSFFHYSTPTSPVSSTAQVTYNANGTFSNTSPNKPGITDISVNEIDFGLQGFSYYKVTGSELQPITSNSLGWYYDKSADVYNWYDRVTGSPSLISDATSAGYLPVGGQNNSKGQSVGYRLNNFLIKFIPYSYFNLYFDYQNISNFPLEIYTSYTQPSNAASDWATIVTNTFTPPSDAVLIASLTQSFSGTYSSYDYYIPESFYSLRGNQYLYIVGPFVGASASGTTYSSVYLRNLRIEGGYHPGNNRQYVMSNYVTYSTITGLTGATYTTFVGSGNTVNATSSLINPGISEIYAKIGNGTFKAGIWENGVWNSGWRVDNQMYTFYNIYQFFGYNKDKRWRVQISGPTSSVANFNIGDNVSIGNIVAIDINEERKLLKGYYTIINKTDTTIVVEFDNNFPIRRIEKDSDNHRIYVTKNVWLSGGFLNGYFTGIWNYGLFKGYPLITEMYDSHWIDGIFDGGHFSTTLYTVPDFSGTLYQSGSLGLTFSSPHGLVVGDLITVNKDNKLVNPQYDGDHYVTSVVNNYQVVIDVDYGNDLLPETGKITIDKSKGLLQRVDFRSNNISSVTSNSSLESNAVFIYNSWIDVTYNSSYASNIGKPQTLTNYLSNRTYSENNLYGYITNDVLESNSTFRDSFSKTVRKYRLGTKYKIFGDFIGDSGNFTDSWASNYGTYSSSSESTFVKYGWTFSRWDDSSLTFSRTEDIGINSIIGEELKVQSIRNGGILDITPFSDIFVENKIYEDVQRFRYTKIDFDLVTYSNNISQSSYLKHSPYSYKLIGLNALLPGHSPLSEPPIHFNNLNYVNRSASLSSAVYGSTASVTVNATYLPVYQNVNHITTPKKKKTEYFYNKRNLAMHFYGISPTLTDTAEYVIDNLHFYEVDMIPFFQYFTDDNINQGIQIPFQGISPFIDYSNANFNFIDNISIGLDSINTQNSNTVVSGVGAGIGSAPTGGTTIYTTRTSVSTGRDTA